MKIEPSPIPSHVKIDCPHCGALYDVSDWRTTALADTIGEFLERNRLCPTCCAIAEQEAEETKRRAAAAARLARLPATLEKCGFPIAYTNDRATGKLFSEPPCRYACVYIWQHRTENLLLSGTTGSGKSTSACFVATKLIAQGKHCRYSKLRDLLARWRDAKTSDRPYATERLLGTIKKYDVYIIDEVVGKANVTASGQELLFELLESVNAGNCHAKIWLLGNFYAGSIEELFTDAEPVRRRLAENFTCARLDRDAETVTPLEVYKGAVR